MIRMSTVLLLTATIFSGAVMLGINSLQVNAESNKEEKIFFEEVRKPDGSGYIFDDLDGISLSVDNIGS
ncbi:MAG: hypothetical protein RR437_09045 [Clostridium sp.]|uniref:hypothetical protein n=2 Tax=Clostridium sp. TaxID=1506 RepID=UPI002FC8C9A9